MTWLSRAFLKLNFPPRPKTFTSSLLRPTKQQSRDIVRMSARWLLLAVTLCGLSETIAQNVLGVDFGSEYIKLAVVQRSAGVQIVLNEATKRKSPNAMSFGDTQREFGDTAMVKPHLAITHTRELLGKSAKADLVKVYGPHYFPYEIIPDDERGTVKIKERDRFLSPEVLVAMVLTYAKSLAQAHTKEKVADCVITVPSFFKQFERQAILDAAAIAGLNVLSLMNDHTAVALKYGTDNNVAEFKEPQNVLFYDMGSTATRVSLIQFSSIPDKDSFDKNKTLGQLKVLGVSWDETLGGTAFSNVVADILKGKSKQDPSKNFRAMAKLGATAEKAKVILSANKEAHPTIESFIDDYDFRASISRTEFEEAAQSLFDRVTKPVDDVLRAANISAADLHKVEMIGGGWRIPKVQDILLAHTNRPILDKTMNGDEAFCFGAALYAASLSTTFRLRKFGVHDTTQFAVSIDLDASNSADSVEEEEGKESSKSDEQAAPSAATQSSGKKNIKLFRVGHKMPSKRLLSFMRDEDLSFVLKYDDESASGEPVFIARYNITGVPAAVARYPNASKPKIGVSFRLSRSGLIDIDKAEAALDQLVDVEVCSYVKPNVSATNSSANGTNATADGAASTVSEDPLKSAEGTTANASATNETGANGTAGNETDAKATPQTTEPAPQRVCTMKQEKRTFRVPLRVATDSSAVRALNASEIRDAKSILDGYEEREAKIRERASAFNALESYIYITREKLEANTDLIAVTTAEFRTEFMEKLSKAGSWLEEEGWEADTATLQQKLGELTAVGDPAFWRVKEMIDRPDIVKKFREMLNVTQERVTNLTKERSWLNLSHTELVTNKTRDYSEWLDNVTEAQGKHPPHERPIFVRDDIYSRAQALDNAMRDLLRVRPPLPPPPSKKPSDKAKWTKDKKPSPNAANSTADATAQDKAEQADSEKPHEAASDSGTPEEEPKDKEAENPTEEKAEEKQQAKEELR